MRKIALLATLLFAPFCFIMAQVTTGSITGSVKVPEGKPVGGATILATLLSSGTNYSAYSRDNGQFTLPALRVGGPYTVTIKFVGLKDQVFTDVYITLGQPVVINAIMQDQANTLNGVTVSAKGKGLISSQRTGTSTIISSRLLQSAPTISRSIQDFARLSPQAKVGNSSSNGAGAGTSFAGQSNRYNQFSVDGANASDGFGLSGTGTNGGTTGINPISLETIQEVQMVLSPYDVTQGGFTGGGINAVTKSGTNTFHGAAYGQYQNQSFVGKSPGYNSTITRASYQNFKNYTFGASFGGPIIKNKLFFYANVERFKKSVPLSYDPTVAGSGSFVNTKTLDSIKTYLVDTWKWDPGTYGTINAETQSTSAFARVDWNISNMHKLVFRFNHVDGTSDNISRTTTSSVFSNGGFVYRNKTNSAVVELNSSFKSNASNTLRITYTSVRDNHGSKSPFPTISIYQRNIDNATNILYNIGTNNSYHANGLNQDVFTITDNFTIYKGKHTITFGTNDEFFKSKNIFLQNFFGNYTYGTSSYAGTNVNNFVNNTGLSSYAVGYSNSADKGDKAPAIMKVGQLSAYGQDLFNVNDRVKLTYGLRVDLPVYFNKPDENAAFATAFGLSTNQMPKATPLWSPRVGFNWDVNGNAQTQLRGGAGIFTGRLPFVWLSNNYTNTAVATSSYSNTDATSIAAAGIKFNYNPSDPHKGAYIPTTGTNTNLVNVSDKKFKFPQVFRANLAVDQKLNVWGLIGTLEGVYTKTLNNAYVSNLNLTDQGDGSVAIGSTTRQYWSKRANTSWGDVMKLNNTSQGYSYMFTAQVQKPLSMGWSGSVAYTYGHTTSLSDLTSSVATSNWRGTLVTNGLNHPDVATSNYNMGSRIIAHVTKEFRYAKRFGTSFTLIYTGQSGQRMSYLYSNNILGDDPSSPNSATTLAYIPKTATEANFVDITSGTTTITATQQWQDFQTLVANNKYLKEHQGEVVKRNGDKMPFEHHFDLRIAQDITFKGGHKIQLFFDILNFSNLLNKNWGWSYTTSTTGDGLYTSSKTLFTVVTSGAQKKDGVAVTAPTKTAPAFQFYNTNFTNIKGIRKTFDVSDFNSRWNSQIGLRYSF